MPSVLPTVASLVRPPVSAPTEPGELHERAPAVGHHVAPPGRRRDRFATGQRGPEDVAVEVDFTVDEQQSVSSIDCPPGQPAPTGEVGAVVGTPGPTLPPTDTLSSASTESTGPVVVAAGLVGLSVGLLKVLPRRRRART
jgi:hypothetical protein